ncbi:MAG: DUF1343 domain-containing protein [Tannerella sp.]|jgi:uncharacterized protein YbbC (DUF1343 family)|nr:DUF1343 domain-containing protein [Tannerella sp.]
MAQAHNKLIIKNINKVSFSSILVIFSLISQLSYSQHSKQITLGAERVDTIVALVENKRVGLALNHTSILEDAKVHLLDTLLAKGVDIKKVFAPEHGFRGTADAGEEIKDSRDLKTGIPIISLYGKNKKPTAAQLNDLDVIIFDMQDVGTRFFTYISTMHYLMEACAEHTKEFIVLDRPNPNDYIDGPVRKAGYESFVSMHPIPVLHGLTIGELAEMINGEGWLKTKEKKCRLTVVNMLNWKHGDPYWLPAKPSPNLPNEQSIRLYPSLCFFEGTSISVGRGTYFPFQVLGYPDPEGGDFTFTPVALEGLDTNPMYKDQTCYGMDLREYPFEGGLSLQFILDFYKRLNNNEKAFFSRAKWFDLLAGTNSLRLQISEGLSEDEIRASWEPDLNAYKEMRQKYLLYPDYPEH